MAIAIHADARPDSMGWLLGCLILLTLGELLVAPRTQSLVSQFAPPHRTASILALWYAAVACRLCSLGYS